MLREIVLDTETTGTEARNGDRLIEIGCVELINHVQTGETFHRLINPQRAVSEGAFAVHGISDAMLADKPVFAEVVDAFLEFCGDARLVIHNAPFDVGFLNMEFARLGPAAPKAIALEDVVDTLLLARRKHPGAANNTMPCATATAWTPPAASSTARCSTRRSWPRSMSSCSAASRPAWGSASLSRPRPWRSGP